ncbi:hypothetical protein GCK32_015264, partial [Trichostrongylus colubriformis]
MNILLFSKNQSTAIYHAFIIIAYGSPILGSILSDGYIGKFWTILAISILYAIGLIMLATAAAFPPESYIHPFLDLLSIFTVGLGTGGIKPCVAAFGGDQFPKNAVKMISMFFSVFYLSINAGSSHSCMGQDSCFPLAFGLPATLMVLAIVIFLVGSPYYVKNPPTENIFAIAFYEITSAIRNRPSASEKHDHWLDYAMEGHECEDDERCCKPENKKKGRCAKRKFIEDLKGVFRVVIMLLPVPMFWALFEQQ